MCWCGAEGYGLESLAAQGEELESRILKFIYSNQTCENIRILLNAAEKLSQNNKTKPVICQTQVLSEKSKPCYVTVSLLKTAWQEEGSDCNIFQFASVEVFSR